MSLAKEVVGFVLQVVLRCFLIVAGEKLDQSNQSENVLSPCVDGSSGGSASFVCGVLGGPGNTDVQ